MINSCEPSITCVPGTYLGTNVGLPLVSVPSVMPLSSSLETTIVFSAVDDGQSFGLVVIEVAEAADVVVRGCADGNRRDADGRER